MSRSATWSRSTGAAATSYPTDKASGVALEPAIAVFTADLYQRDGTKPLSQERFDTLSGDVSSDAEG